MSRTFQKIVKPVNTIRCLKQRNLYLRLYVTQSDGGIFLITADPSMSVILVECHQ
jgi:hypothetical protein